MEVVYCYFSVKSRDNHFYVENAVETENENFDFYKYKTQNILSENEAIILKDELQDAYMKGTLIVDLDDEEQWDYLHSD